MAYFAKDAKTRLVTDASSFGLGDVLEQQQEDGSYRPVHYPSHKLSNVEKRYSQFEREARAVRWACQKFYLYSAPHRPQTVGDRPGRQENTPISTH